MKRLKIYMDNSCLNRPFDDQFQLKVRLQTEAKLDIQQRVLNGDLDMVWSYMVDYENHFNPFEERRRTIDRWKKRSVEDVGETPAVLRKAAEAARLGLSSRDAIHVACAIVAGCDCFLTTDDDIVRKMKGSREIRAITPADFVSAEEP
jgi:hypothetical protein